MFYCVPSFRGESDDLIKSVSQNCCMTIAWNGCAGRRPLPLLPFVKSIRIHSNETRILCTQNGLFCSFPVPEILCGDTPILPHTGQVWNGSSTPGSTVTYYCKIGFYHNAGNNISLCTLKGHWTKPNISCKGNNLFQNCC